MDYKFNIEENGEKILKNNSENLKFLVKYSN